MPKEQDERADSATLEAWCRQASAGDPDALTSLLAAHRGRLAGYTRRKIGPDWQGKIDDDDIIQEAYIDIVNAIQTFTYRDEDSFYHWATHIIDHKFIDQVRHLRRRKRDAAREITPRDGLSRHESFLANCFADSTTASRVMRREEAVGALMTCIARLSPDHLEVVKRHYLQQEPLSTIAADMGRTPDAVRRLASRAVDQLQRCMHNASHFFTSREV